jgi:hypothetical protein
MGRCSPLAGSLINAFDDRGLPMSSQKSKQNNLHTKLQTGNNPANVQRRHPSRLGATKSTSEPRRRSGCGPNSNKSEKLQDLERQAVIRNYSYLFSLLTDFS